MGRYTVTPERKREAVRLHVHRSLASAWVVLSVTLLTMAGFGQAALACTEDADCNDGLACNGVEVCDTQTGACQSGSVVDCAPFVDQCNDAECAEPSGSCTVTPRLDGFACYDGNRCTTLDTCQAGVCVGGGGADTDGDGYCDSEEVRAGCDPEDPAEIPPQSNVFSGGRSANPGEILLAFHSPADGTLRVATDPACATVGHCNNVSNSCTSGRIADPCTSDLDCNQPPLTCRLVINYASTPDVSLSAASTKIPKQKASDCRTEFRVTPGCSEKVDVTLPAGFGKARLKLKASGTLGEKVRKDTDRVLFIE